MLRTTMRVMTWTLIGLGLCSARVNAQQANPQEAGIDAVRSRPTFSAGDQDRIKRWVQFEVDKFSAFKPFRKRFSDQFNNSSNSPGFKLQVAKQAGLVAVARLGGGGLSPAVSRAYVHVLIDMNHAEAVPGLLAGLSNSDAATRYLCAKGLAGQRRAIAGGNGTLASAVKALQDAGLAESDPIVLGQIYLALSHGGNVADVFGAFLAIFDARLIIRRKAGAITDGAEINAIEFFRVASVLGALDTTQKRDLVTRLAVLLRINAERYATENLSINEAAKIEAELDGLEAILEGLGIGNGGKIRDALSVGGAGKFAAVKTEAYRWVGDATASTPGALGAAPWNVPTGAP